MAAQNRKTNITGLVINLQSQCQNVCFEYYCKYTTIYDFYDSILPPKSKMAAKNC